MITTWSALDDTYCILVMKNILMLLLNTLDFLKFLEICGMYFLPVSWLKHRVNLSSAISQPFIDLYKTSWPNPLTLVHRSADY
jgi:hypothetical protein